MDKCLLFGTSPVNVAENLRDTISKQDTCHREVDFSESLAGNKKK